ncbi:hypothetical protein OAA15_00405 [bacterium]|nr:hypothetical protein [bacterium]
MTQKSELTPEELLKQSVVKVKGMENMDLVPYSIALQALTMEKANKVVGEVEKHVSELANIESELSNILKILDK